MSQPLPDSRALMLRNDVRQSYFAVSGPLRHTWVKVSTFFPSAARTCPVTDWLAGTPLRARRRMLK